MEPEIDDLHQLANWHWLTFYRVLIELFGGEWRRFGGVDAFSTSHVPATFVNGLIVVEPASAADVTAAIDWVRGPGVPFSVRIDASLAQEVLDAPVTAGLERDPWVMPGMVLTPVPDAPSPPSGVEAERVVASNHADFIDATVGAGFPREMAEMAFDLSATENGDLDYFVGRLDGRPVSTSTLVRTGDVGGIYAVATVADARGRGVGSAVTWAAVERAREWGARAVVLQSTEMGFHVYHAIGFKTAVEYLVYGPAET